MAMITLCCSSLVSSEEFNVTIVTEHLPPLQINNKQINNKQINNKQSNKEQISNDKQKPTGAMVEIVEQLLTISGIKGKITFYPWARAYQIAQNRPNTLIFSIMRTQAREHSFHWVGSLLADKVYLMRLASRNDLTINHIDQAKQYRVGVHRSDIAQQYLQDKGFTIKRNILLSSSYFRLWQSLWQGKVDFITANEFMLQDAESTFHQNFRPVSITLTLDDFAQNYYLAASLNTSPIIIKKLQKALEKLKQSGQYLAILKKWQLVEQ